MNKRPRLTAGAERGVGARFRWIGADLVPGHFFEGEDVVRRIVPFVPAGVLPFLLLPFLGVPYSDWRVLAAGALVPLIVSTILLTPWQRLPGWTQALPVFASYAIIALLRDASGADAPVFEPLVIIPVAWFALYGTRPEMVTSTAAMGATMALPVLLIGEPNYDGGQLARAVIAVIIAGTLGAAIQSLVMGMRQLAAESRAILDTAQDAFISVDQSRRILEWNPGAERTFGWSRSEALGRDVLEMLVHPDDREDARSRMGRFDETGLGPLGGDRSEGRALRKDGTEIPIELTISPIEIDGRWIFNTFARDISGRKRSQRALQEAEERFRRAFEDNRVGMALVSADGEFLRVNHALTEIVGIPGRELTGKRFAEITHPDDLEADVGALREIAEGKRFGYRTEKRYLHAQGHYVWVALNVSPIHDEQGQVVHMISQVEDITERKETEAKLTHQALHDPLTGLPNRVLFSDRVRMSATRRENGSFSVIYLDLDTFKPINDTLGHAAGDRVLVEVARRLEKLLREGDTLARLGGDEFAILCEGADEAAARLVAERVIDAFSKPFDVEGREVVQAASIGVAIHPRNGRTVDPDDILRDADHAMYTAKAAGKSRYAMFEGWMGADAAARSGLEDRLRKAISTGELTVHYQPEIDLRTGAVNGAEALVRWEHPERGLLEPAQFMFAAEASGLIAEIDDYVLWQACHQAASWREAIGTDESFSVSVNLSERRLADATLSGKIAQAISDANLPPSALCLEIAERAVLDRRADALMAIPDIEALGVRLLIDDFGVAISSFSTIKRLPRLSAIKIDSSFIAGIGRSREDSAGVAAIIGLAHGLKLTATAEGVETAEQTAELRALNCDRAQGFHFARPQAPAAFGELLESARYGELLA
jgi:diguanylate cyclase (GGDEF)-like protein/PAS domain S-box-containing protein